MILSRILKQIFGQTTWFSGAEDTVTEKPFMCHIIIDFWISHSCQILLIT
jgi:hypothetical protein